MFKYKIPQKPYGFRGFSVFDEINGRKSFFYVFIILMAIVMESNSIPIIVVDSGCSNDRTAKITPDVFDNVLRVTKIRLCINVESLFMFTVTSGFHLFKRRTNDPMSFS